MRATKKLPLARRLARRSEKSKCPSPPPQRLHPALGTICGECVEGISERVDSVWLLILLAFVAVAAAARR